MRSWRVLLLLTSLTSCHGRNRQRAFREALERNPDAGAAAILDLGDCEITSNPATLENLARVRSLTGHRGSMEAIALSDAGEFLAAGGADGVIRVWDVRRGKLRNRIETRGEVRSIAFRPATTVLAAAGASPEVELWDARSGERRGVLRARSGGVVTALAYDSGARLLASGSSEGLVRLWNPRTSTEVYTFPRVGGGEVRSLSFSPDGATLAVVSGDGGVRIIDTNETRSPRTLRGGARYATFGPNSDTLAIVALSKGPRSTTGNRGDATVELWNSRSGKRVRSLTSASAALRASFNRAGDLLATVHADGAVSLWNLRDGQLRKTLRVLPGSSRIAFSRDGLVLAAASESIDIYEARPWSWRQRSRAPAEAVPPSGATAASLQVRAIGTRGSGPVPSGYPFDLELEVSVGRQETGETGGLREVPSLHGLEARIRIDGFGPEKLAWIGTVRSGEPVQRRVRWVAPLDPDRTTASGTVELRAVGGELITREEFQFFLEGLQRPDLALDYRVVERKPLAFTTSHPSGLRTSRLVNGELLRIAFSLSNRGSIRAESLRGRLIPVSPREQIEFLEAAELDFGDLEPGEAATREVSVRLDEPGLPAIQFRLRARGRTAETSVDELVVIQPGSMGETQIVRPAPSRQAPRRESQKPVPRNAPPAIVVLRPTRRDFSTTDTEVTFVIAITDDTGIASVEFTRNGVPVARGSTRGIAGVARPSPATSSNSDRIHLEQTLELLVGRNEIEIIATDLQGQSTRERRTIFRRPNLGEYYVLCVGIREYPDPAIPDLPVSERDARAVYRFYSTHPKSPARRENVQLLVGKEATAKGIKKILETYLARRAQPRDTVIFYYSGHGFAHGEKYYLVPRDGELDALGATSIDMKELQKLWDLVAAERKVFIADACNSGGFTVLRDLGASSARSGFTGLVRPSEGGAGSNAPTSMGRGCAVLTASSSNERAIEDARLGHGIYTYHLLEGLEGRADANRDGRVNLTEVHAYLQSTVPVSARRLGHKQTPNAKLDVSGEIYLTR